MHFRLCRLLAWIAAISLSAMPAGAISLGQIDTFQDGTMQGWTGGVALTNQPNGGPGGTGDRYLRLSTNNSLSQLGIYNNVQWAGNYASAGVTRVDFALANFGPDTVSLRIMILSPGCQPPKPFVCTAWASTNATVLPAGSGWVNVDFGLNDAALTRVLGSASLASVLANVDRLHLRDDGGAVPSPPGTASSVNAVIGVDNITAFSDIPEPGTVLLLALGLAGLGVLGSGGAREALLTRVLRRLR
jgi:hypothetical protein